MTREELAVLHEVLHAAERGPTISPYANNPSRVAREWAREAVCLPLYGLIDAAAKDCTSCGGTGQRWTNKFDGGMVACECQP